MILSVCNVPEVLKIMKIVKVVILILKIAVPIILIVLAMLDFARAVVSKDNDSLSQSIKIATKRFITAAIIFLLPTAVNIIFNVIAPNISYKDCFDNATDEKIEAIYEETMSNLIKEAENTASHTAVASARNYLKNIENEEKFGIYKETIDEVEKKIEEKEEEERRKQSAPSSGSGSTYVPPADVYKNSGMYSDWSSVDNSSFLAKAKEIWNRIQNSEQSFVYHNWNYIPITNNLCDCSSYVSWVLYEYGYSDFGNTYQHDTDYFYNNVNTGTYPGWEVKSFAAGENMAPYLKPGDIVVRRAAKGHTDIVASISDEGVVYAYDCGSTPAVTKGAYPNGYPAGFFYADDRPGKIIRVP